MLGILLAPFGAVHLQERIFRYRAGHLLSDMRFLVGHQANLPEIQAVFKHWDPHACSEQGCTIEGDSWRTSFSVNRVVNSEDAASDWHPIWLPPLFRTYGGRIAHVEASAGIVGGTMRVISFEVNMEISPSHGVSDYHAGNHLSGSAYSGYPFSIRDDWQGLTLHPSYVIGGANLEAWYPWWATSAYVAFAPHVEGGDVKRLMSFDLSCLTRWRPCREPIDLMPEAVAQHAKEELQLAQARKNHVCGPIITALMARDALYAGVVEVMGSHEELRLNEGQINIPNVRLIENFDKGGHWKIGENRDLEIYDVNTNRDITDPPPEVHTGNRLIVLAESEKHHPVLAERCGILPLNPANLELVRQAVAGNLPSTKP